MPGGSWTSRTLPQLTQPEGVGHDEPWWRQLRKARAAAYRSLLAAEETERALANLRSLAKIDVEHFKSLYEELVTDPLFDMEKEEK